MSTRDRQEQEFSFKSLFAPFTTLKAIHWIIVIGLMVYASSLFNSFVFDDTGSIVNNPSVHTLSKILTLFVNQLSGFDENIFYRPMPFIIYTIIYSFSGSNTFFYHLFQLLFHIANTLLIFIIFKRFLNIPLAFVMSLLYLLHPINQEAVIYISAMPETLFVFFGLIAFYLIQKNTSNVFYIICANIALFFSLFSKETSVLFIVMMFYYIFFFKRQKLVFHSISTLIIVVFYGVLRLNAHIKQPDVAVVPMMHLPFWERMKSVPEMILFYIHSLILPLNITHTNSWFVKDITFTNFFLPLVFDVLFFIGICWLVFSIEIKKRILALFFLCWFLSGLAIHLQFVPIDATVATRYFYFSLIGLLGVIGLFLQQLTISRVQKKLSLFCYILLLIFYSVILLITNYNWRTQYTIVIKDQNLRKDDYLQELLYSSELIKLEKYSEAYPHALKATELYSQSYYAWNNVGVASYYMNNIAEAKEAYSKAINLADYYGVYDNMALLLVQKGDLLTAREFLRKAIAKFANDEKLWGYRIYVEYKTGDLDNAKYAAKQYYLLKRDTRSQYFYDRLMHNLPID